MKRYPLRPHPLTIGLPANVGPTTYPFDREGNYIGPPENACYLHPSHKDYPAHCWSQRDLKHVKMWMGQTTPRVRAEVVDQTTLPTYGPENGPENGLPVSTPLIIGGAVLIIGGAVLLGYLGYRVGSAMAPTKAKEKKYGWIGVGTVVFGLPLLRFGLSTALGND